MEKLTLGLSTTAIGLLVVFFGLAVLILLIILMGKINEASNKKTEKKELPAKEQIPVQPEETVQEEADDSELIAVISAAVAAVWDEKQGGFVVRRVKRIHNAAAWEKSGREQQLYGRM